MPEQADAFLASPGASDHAQQQRVDLVRRIAYLTSRVFPLNTRVRRPPRGSNPLGAASRFSGLSGCFGGRVVLCLTRFRLRPCSGDDRNARRQRSAGPRALVASLAAHHVRKSFPFERAEVAVAGIRKASAYLP
jgi:hypothetical protein